MGESFKSFDYSEKKCLGNQEAKRGPLPPTKCNTTPALCLRICSWVALWIVGSDTEGLLQKQPRLCAVSPGDQCTGQRCTITFCIEEIMTLWDILCLRCSAVFYLILKHWWADFTPYIHKDIFKNKSYFQRKRTFDNGLSDAMWSPLSSFSKNNTLQPPTIHSLALQ